MPSGNSKAQKNGKNFKNNHKYAEKLARVARAEARPEHTDHQPPTKYYQGTCTPLSCGKETACMPYNSTVYYCRCTSNGMPSDEDFECPRRTIKFYQGTCSPLSCGKEAACLPYNSTVHYCRCMSDGLPAPEDFKCPRRTVSVTPMPIYNIMLPRSLNTSTHPRYVSSTPTTQNSESLVIREILAGATTGNDSRVLGPDGNTSTDVLLVALATGVALLMIVVSIVAWYLKRRICHVDGKTQPYGVYLASTTALPGPGAAMGGAFSSDDTSEPQVLLLDRNELTFLEEVGEGCFGKVHKGLLRASYEDKVVAIKVFKESAGRSAEEDFVREVSIISAFRHPNILTLVGFGYRDNISANPWMVFEFMEWGDLAGVLRGSRGVGGPGQTLDAPALLHVALQVARGMQYLASCLFVHRDLAARNCLVGAHLAVKIADFGMSRDVYTCDYFKIGGERPMPVRWMSPESIVYARFTHESDVWSYGVVLWEIYSRGKQPFYGHSNDDATRLILQGIVLVAPEDCPKFACKLMSDCWKSDPRDRMGFDEICKKLEDAAGVGGQRPPQTPVPQDYVLPTRQPKVYQTLSLPKPKDDGLSQSSNEGEKQ